MSSAPTFRRRNPHMNTGQTKMCKTNHPKPVPALPNNEYCKSCAFTRNDAKARAQATAKEREEQARKK
jgi:hypothetical protein